MSAIRLYSFSEGSLKGCLEEMRFADDKGDNTIACKKERKAKISKYTQELLTSVDSQPWESLANRRIQHYGYKFDYKVCISATTTLFWNLAEPEV